MFHVERANLGKIISSGIPHESGYFTNKTSITEFLCFQNLYIADWRKLDGTRSLKVRDKLLSIPREFLRKARPIECQKQLIRLVHDEPAVTP